MTARRKTVRPPRERDLRDLHAYRDRTERRVANALITVLCRADAATLAALGTVVQFVADQAPRRLR